MGDENFILFKVHVQVVIILLNSVDQLGHTRGGSVFQNRLAEIPHGLKKLRRGLHVGLANVQMIDLTAFGLPPPLHRDGTSASGTDRIF